MTTWLADPESDVDRPCPWPVDPVCCPGWPTDPAQLTDRHREAIAMATEILWRATAGQYGPCPIKIRPCKRGCTPDGYGTMPLWGPGVFPYGTSSSWVLNPYIDGFGRWFNFGCGCNTDCSCTPMCIIEIPGYVHEILEVRIDGVVLPQSGNWLFDRRPNKARLIRTGPAAHDTGHCWPDCQDMTLPDTAAHTFSVTYTQGRPVPPGGVRAVSALACELYKQCNQGACVLPTGIRTIQREGLSIEILPPGDWLETLRIHMPDVFRWVTLVNPHGHQQAPAVFSLDLPQAPMYGRVNYP